MVMKINGLYIQERDPDAVIGGCIEIFENAWPEPYRVISAVENEVSTLDNGINWQKAQTYGGGAYQDIRTNLIMDVTYLSDTTNNLTMQNISNMFYTLILSTTNSYSYRLGIQESFYHENYQLLKYKKNQEYKAHYDGGTNLGRCLSVLCYLNDDYEGGELEFVNFKVKIKPEPGMLIIFPSNFAYKHISHPVKEGTKYALVTWVKDRQV
jgi:hypothetical protein